MGEKNKIKKAVGVHVVSTITGMSKVKRNTDSTVPENNNLKNKMQEQQGSINIIS